MHSLRLPQERKLIHESKPYVYIDYEGQAFLGQEGALTYSQVIVLEDTDEPLSSN